GLGNYGGATSTMIPLPGSSAICAGQASLIAKFESNYGFGFTADQRGKPMTNSAYPGYSTTPCVDAGSVQTDYALSFTANPPATVYVDNPFTAAVTLDESGAPFNLPVSIPLALNPSGVLTGGSAATANGIASYSALAVTSAAAADSLSANLVLNPMLKPALALSAASSTFNATLVPTSTAVGLSNTSIVPGQGVTIAAAVTSQVSGSGAPIGSVSFFDNGALLGTVPLTVGAARYTTEALAPGMPHTITAGYSGNAEFAASSSAAGAEIVTVAPLDFTLSVTAPPGLTVAPGSSVSFQFNVSPDYGSYAGPVSFAMTGLPAGATVTFSPSSIAANGGPQTVTATITVPPSSAQLQASPQPNGRPLAPLALGAFALFGLAGMRRRGKAVRRLLCVLVLLAGGAATLILNGCGGTGFFTQAPKDYTVTLTAVSGPVQHSSNFTLNVQ
ncbi:MAG: Ig-like domain repeat protein, partial [Acidobacteriota bacterium]